MRPLVWFRTDLRVTDHPALYHACRDASRGVVALFVATPKQWKSHDWGRPKADFVQRCVGALRDDLEALHVPLLVRTVPRFRDVPALLSTILRESACDALYFNDEVALNERRRDAAVCELLATNSAGGAIQIRRFTDQTVFDPQDINTGAGKPYSVFTPFRKRWLSIWEEAGGVAPLPKPKRQDAIEVDSEPVPDFAAEFAHDAHADRWPAGHAEAERRLRDFIAQRANDYHDARDWVAVDGTSQLSPYLACGAISVRQCLAAVQDANDGQLDSGSSGLTHWATELIWREFYRCVVARFDHVNKRQAFRTETDAIRWEESDDHFDAWANGSTGIPIVDAAMRQLNDTGWMHNRARMIVAMFLSKNLFLDWRRGERYFMQRLVDADFCSNNGGWQWSASTGTDAAPYFRIFNPESQSERFDPEGDYIRHFVPELNSLSRKQIHAPSDEQRARCDYPPAIVDLKATRLRAIERFKTLRGAE